MANLRLNALLVLIATVTVAGSTRAQSVSSGIPPTELLSKIALLRLPVNHPGVIAHVDYDMPGKTIKFVWRSKAHGNEVAATQKESVSYWPTCLAGYGQNKLLVAGKRNARGRDNTVIELWTLESITAPPLWEGVPGGSGFFHPFQVAVESRTVVYDRSDPGRDIVRAMFRHSGTSDSILVLFYDSKDLYSISSSTGSYALTLSSTPNGAVEHEPALANPYTMFWSGEHATHGYTYVLHTEWEGPDSGVPSLVLSDADKDGVLDPGGRFLVDVDSWISMGFADNANWIK